MFNSTKRWYNMHVPKTMDDLLASKLDYIVDNQIKGKLGSVTSTNTRKNQRRNLRTWNSPIYKRINSDLPKKISSQALIYGSFKYIINDSVQALIMKFYNSTVTGSNKIQLGQLASSIWNQPHMQVLKNLYDQYKFTGFSIKFKHAGSMVQDDNTLATIPTPVGVCI